MNMEKVLDSLSNVFKIPDLRNRILFTFGILALYRLGCHVLVPGVDRGAIAALFEGDNNLLGMVNMFSGGALANAAVFSLGIMPYITASIILQILQKTMPYLERLSKEGEQGRNKINRYTRYLTVLLALIQSFGMSSAIIGMDGGNGSIITVDNPLLFRMLAMTTLTTGAVVIMWLGEKITERGIGNGISLIIFASIVVTVPSAVIGLVQKMTTNAVSGPVLMLVIAIIVGIVVFVVFFELGVRKITVQFAKGVTKGGQMSGGASYLPFKVNSAGVIPVIFSASVIQIPGLAQQWLQSNTWLQQSGGMQSFLRGTLEAMQYGYPLNNVIFFVLTVFFTFFYVDMLFNPGDTADNLKKRGGFIPGIRPGADTKEYIQGVLDRLTFWGSLYLSMICIVPIWIIMGLKLDTLPGWLGGEWFATNLPAAINQGTGVNLAMALGGTSLLIMISVALDFVNQVENQLIMRKYDGFTSGAKTVQRRTRRYA